LTLRRLALVALALVAGGCADDSVTGGPDPLPDTRLVTVTVEYRQPNGCLNSTGRCNDRVVFFGSWMHGADSVLLTQTTGSFVWTGRATGVPVNFPPRDQPYLVRVFDPHLVDTASGGVTASRLIVGGQAVTYFDQPGTSSESGVIYIDDNGNGRNPF
jgi:hypothetical protein